MKEKTREALQASILHWKENLRKAKDEELQAWHIGDTQCALCARFPDCDFEAEPCPVYLSTGRKGCLGSPWTKVNNALRSGSRVWQSRDFLKQQLVSRVEEELHFLQSLLVEEQE